jgi:glycosidase
MWGADDPDCRKPLWWKEFQFEPETRTNLLKRTKEYDTIGFNQDLYNFYKMIIQIRKENPVLSSGEIEFLITDGNCLSYRRFNEQEEILVMFNLESEKREFKLTKNKTYQNLLNDNRISVESILLDPLSAVMLKTVNSK